MVGDIPSRRMVQFQTEMKRSDFDLQTGVEMVCWELAALDDPVDPKRDFLREDLVQVVFHSGTIVDVGWYPSFSGDGAFKVVLVLGQNWEAPLRTAHCRTVRELSTVFDEFLEQARRTPPADGPA
jgi:hypothetical protein